MFSNLGTSLVVQWLRLQASNARDVGLIPGRGTKIACAARPKKKKKKPKIFSNLDCPCYSVESKEVEITQLPMVFTAQSSELSEFFMRYWIHRQWPDHIWQQSLTHNLCTIGPKQSGLVSGQWRRLPSSCSSVLPFNPGPTRVKHRHTLEILWIPFQTTSMKQKIKRVTQIFWFPSAYKSYV